MKECPTCKGSKLERGKVEQSFEIGDGRDFVVVLQATVCPCGESFVDGPLHEAAEIEVARRLADSGEPTGPSFRFMRKVLGFSAKALAQELGLTPETISRWETGERPIDPAVWLIVANMAADPNGRESDMGRMLRVLAKRRSGEMPAAPKSERFELSDKRAS